MSISIKTILGQMNIRALMGNRKGSNQNGGVREGARHGRSLGTTTANGRQPHTKVLTREKCGVFDKKKRANVVELSWAKEGGMEWNW